MAEENRFVPPPRIMPHPARVRTNAGEAPRLRPLTRDDYPLVEIVTDVLLDGLWLYLHPTPEGAERPRFLPRTSPQVLKKTCADMLTSYYTRTTPPITPPPASVAHVYTATDHLAD